MLDVVIALVPAMVGSVYFFGWRALAMTAVSAASAVFFEWLYRKLMKKPSSISDLSAVVTGILLAFCCPVTMPYWMLIAGNAVAIIIVKQLYGGIGKNFMNPALIGRAFMLSWPAAITRWTAVFEPVKIIGTNADAVTTATPLAELSRGALAENYDILGMFLGKVPGCIGEVSAALLILGGLYLLGNLSQNSDSVYGHRCDLDVPLSPRQRRSPVDGLKPPVRRPRPRSVLYGY